MDFFLERERNFLSFDRKCLWMMLLKFYGQFLWMTEMKFFRWIGNEEEMIWEKFFKIKEEFDEKNENDNKMFEIFKDVDGA